MRRHIVLIAVGVLLLTAGCLGTADTAPAEQTDRPERNTQAVYFTEYNATCVLYDGFEGGGISCHDGRVGNPEETTTTTSGLDGTIVAVERGSLVCFTYDGFEAGDNECLERPSASD